VSNDVSFPPTDPIVRLIEIIRVILCAVAARLGGFSLSDRSIDRICEALEAMMRGMVREAATARPELSAAPVASPVAGRRKRAVLVRRSVLLAEPWPLSGTGLIEPVAPVIEALAPETAIERRTFTNRMRVRVSGAVPLKRRVREPIVMRLPESSVSPTPSLKKPQSPHRLFRA
jgi:hypothetical protein